MIDRTQGRRGVASAAKDTMKKQEVEGGKKQRVTADGRMVVISSSDEKDHESRVWSSVFI